MRVTQVFQAFFLLCSGLTLFSLYRASYYQTSTSKISSHWNTILDNLTRTYSRRSLEGGEEADLRNNVISLGKSDEDAMNSVNKLNEGDEVFANIVSRYEGDGINDVISKEGDGDSMNNVSTSELGGVLEITVNSLEEANISDMEVEGNGILMYNVNSLDRKDRSLINSDKSEGKEKDEIFVNNMNGEVGGRIDGSGKRWTRAKNLLPPGVSLAHFRRYLMSQLQNGRQGEEEEEEEAEDGDEEWSEEVGGMIEDTCDQYPDVMTTPSYATYRKIYQHLLYHPQRRLVYCPVWKSMSTSWDAYFLQMSQDEEDSDENTLNNGTYEMAGNVKRAARQRFQLPLNNDRAREVLGKAQCSVVIVRHPMERLISAYRDKMIARNSTVKDYLYLRDIIKHRYRTNSSDQTTAPNFREFVDFVLDEWSSSDPRPGTWREWSRDWHPTYYLCAPCHLNYTHFLRYEHYSSDVNSFREACGLSDVRLEGTHHHQLGNTSSVQMERDLYGQLSRGQVVRLAQVYFIDLLMFGFKISKYLEFARPD